MYSIIRAATRVRTCVFASRTAFATFKRSTGFLTRPPSYNIPIQKAKADYLLDDEELQGLRHEERKISYDDTEIVRWFSEEDLQTAAKEKMGSFRHLEEEKRFLVRQSAIGVSNNPGVSLVLPLGGLSRRKKKHELMGSETEVRDVMSSKPSDSHRTGSTAVYAAIGGNALVTVGKLFAFVYTGSSSILAEAVHSFADTANQVLLAIGIRKAQRSATAMHPYGHAPERFVYALISATGIFFLGAGVSCYHGVMVLFHPSEVIELGLGMKVLAGSLLVEGFTFWVALKDIRNASKQIGVTVWEYIRRGPDPMSVAVLMEDGAAVAGLGIAGTCLGLTAYTGNVVFDAIGSIAVGGILGAVAVFLIRKNKDALLGNSMHPERMNTVMRILKNDDVISSVHDVKAVVLGVNTVRFKAEIKFNAYVLAQRYIAQKMDPIRKLSETGALQTQGDLQAFLSQYTNGVLTFLGEEIDRIEANIQREVPEIRYVDLEIV